MTLPRWQGVRTSVENRIEDGVSCSGWSWVAGVDGVGGPPNSDFTDDGEVRAAARLRPHRLRFVLVGLISDLVGEVGD